MDVTMLIGFAGGLAVLVSFAGVAGGRLSAHSAAYHAMNLGVAIGRRQRHLGADQRARPGAGGHAPATRPRAAHR